jgi:hypothetical protein
MLKRTVVKVAKVIAGIAAIVFVFTPLRTDTQFLLFVASIAVMLICFFVYRSLDDEASDDGANAGYWPSKPIDWSSGQNDSADQGQKRDPVTGQDASSH